MRIQIEITCDSVYHLQAKLSDIKYCINKKTKTLHLSPAEDALPEGFMIEGNDEYGSHKVNVVKEAVEV